MSTDPRCPKCGHYSTGEPYQHTTSKEGERRSLAEEAEHAHMALDYMGAIRERDGGVLSLVERIQTTAIKGQVEAFCRAAGHPVRERPQTPPEDEIRLRVGLILEEFFELLLAVYPRLNDHVSHKTILQEKLDRMQPKPDIVALADACADLDYVVEGTRLAFGIDGGPIATEVQRSNMAKFGPGSWKREDGKQMKPPHWAPPNVESELLKQGWQPPPPVQPESVGTTKKKKTGGSQRKKR